MSIRTSDLPLLVCPDTHGPLSWRGTNVELELQDGVLVSERSGLAWSVEEGWVRLCREPAVKGKKALLHRIYDTLPKLHDPLVSGTLPLFQGKGTERELRSAALDRLDLGALKSAGSGARVRILEVGVGSGANLPYILERLPDGLLVEIWGVDISIGMLERAKARVKQDDMLRPITRLLMADAALLPFADQTFDRVFHIGGIGGMADPGRALAELGRVAKAGTPIVVVDEQRDPAAPLNPLQALAFKAITFYDEAPASPKALLPKGAVGVKDEQISPFYYCLSYRMEGPRAA